MLTETYSKGTVSSYTPPKEVCDFTDYVRKDYSQGVDILNKSWVELNDMSVIERMNRDKRTFNAFVDESVEDPSEAWKWRGTRSKARNKAIALHAQLTAGYIVPMFLAQNDADEEDREFSEVMREIIEWMVDNSNYKSSFLVAAMGMLVNPVTYLGAEYVQVFQKIKEKTDKGYTTTEIIDEVLSGFQAPVYTADQVLITNAHEQNIQRQRGIIKRKYIELSEAKAKYGEHENFQYVNPGSRSIYSSEEGLFYDVKDDEHPALVEESTVYYRRDDTEVCFLGGVYMGNENIEDNPIRHRDNRNAPKYNLVPFGYQRVNEHFFYYKSLMNSQYWDNSLLDAQYEMAMNRAFLDTEMPLGISGSDNINTDIVFPGSVVAIKDPNSKISPLLPQADLGKLFAGMGLVEKSIDESSTSGVTDGQLPDANQKATSVSIAQQNSKIMLQGVGKTLAESMVMYGSLMSDIAINHLTIPQIVELAGGDEKMKYRSFILNNKSVNGKSVTKIIRFDESLLGKEMTKNQKLNKEIKLAIEAGYPKEKSAIWLINPEMFSRMKYLTRVEPERMFPKNEEFMQAMMSQLVAQFEGNPYVSLEALTRETLYQFFRGRTEEFMQKQDMVNTGNILGTDATGKDGKGSMAGNMAVEKGLANGMRSVL